MMSMQESQKNEQVRVRFAPSPTGHLHIGGARTALYCYLYAKKYGGSYILRIEDTDEERSRKEYEEAMIDHLNWLGIEHAEGPDKGGDFGPYRQSERIDLYKKFADTLVEMGKAYPCFLTPQELDRLTAKAKKEKKGPHAYHGFYRDLPQDEANHRIKKGEPYIIRFKNPQETHSFTDLVRQNVTFGPDMVGDFAILRNNGLPVYNFSCVIDDLLMKITHVIRGEEHLPNTLRQLMLYKALEEKPPIFAHVSLLTGKDGQKLSKRHGDTSVYQYREQYYLPDSLMNYLCLLGWSHPEEKDIFDWRELGQCFSPDRFSKSSALYDPLKLKYFNGKHMRRLPADGRLNYLASSIPEHHPFHSQSLKWKEECVDFFKSKFDLPSEFILQLDLIFETQESSEKEYLEIKSTESAQKMAVYIHHELASLKDFASLHDIERWINHIKTNLKIKGRPLFKGMRAALTLRCEGPDLKGLIPLTPLFVLQQRINIFLGQ